MVGGSQIYKLVHKIAWNERECFMKTYVIAFLTMSLSTFAFAGPGQQDTTARLQAAGR